MANYAPRRRWYLVRLRSSRPEILEMVSECETWVSGYRVNRDGDDVAMHGVDRVLRMIHREQIVRIQVMAFNNQTAELEVVR